MNQLYEVIISNVSIEQDEIKYNRFIKLTRVSSTETLLHVEHSDSFKYESNGFLFYRALQLALPLVNLRFKEYREAKDQFFFNTLTSLSTSLINYYPVKDNNIGSDTSSIQLNQENIEAIRKIHAIVCKYTLDAQTKRDEAQWKPHRWQYSYQQYLTAHTASSLENSVLNLITGLESLLIKGEGQLSYRVSLYSSLILRDNPEKREEIFRLVKFMYNLRSKVVHGEVEAAVKILSKPDIYNKYFSLKQILSELLVITFEKNDNELFSRIDEMIFQCPKF